MITLSRLQLAVYEITLVLIWMIICSYICLLWHPLLPFKPLSLCHAFPQPVRNSACAQWIVGGGVAPKGLSPSRNRRHRWQKSDRRLTMSPMWPRGNTSLRAQMRHGSPTREEPWRGEFGLRVASPVCTRWNSWMQWTQWTLIQPRSLPLLTHCTVEWHEDTPLT